VLIFRVKVLVFYNDNIKVIKHERSFFIAGGFNSKNYLRDQEISIFSIRLLGEPTVSEIGHIVKLPTSKRTRSLWLSAITRKTAQT